MSSLAPLRPAASTLPALFQTMPEGGPPILGVLHRQYPQSEHPSCLLQRHRRVRRLVCGGRSGRSGPCDADACRRVRRAARPNALEADRQTAPRRDPNAFDWLVTGHIMDTNLHNPACGSDHNGGWGSFCGVSSGEPVLSHYRPCTGSSGAQLFQAEASQRICALSTGANASSSNAS